MKCCRSEFERSRISLVIVLITSLALSACGDVRDDVPTAPSDRASTSSEVVEAQAVDGLVGPGGLALQEFGPAIRAAARHTPNLMANPAVVGTGVGLNPAGRPAVKVFLAHGQPRGIPTTLDGVPVAPEVTGMFVVRSDRTARARPAPIGFSVGHPNVTAGTLGARVTDGTRVFILSNNHVIANNNSANVGDPTLQPGAVDGGSAPGDVIGTLYDFQPISFSSNNTMDAAIALVNANDVSGSTPAGESYGEPGTTVVEPYLGMAVQKYGRTTGHTEGSVEEINVTVSVCYRTRGPFMCAQSATFVNQFTVTDGSFSAGGDSGSLIVTTNGNQPVGLLFAGSATRTIANPIGEVLERFGVSIDPTVPDSGDPGDPIDPDPIGPTASFSHTCTELTCDFDATGSSAGDAAIATYTWDFGDGGGATGESVSHTYDQADSYLVTLTVADDDGLKDVQSESVTVEAPPGEGEISIEQFDVFPRSMGPWLRADVSWSVSHTGGALASVTSQLLSETSVLDSQSSSVGGSTSSGQHDLRTRSGTPVRVRLIVTDALGGELIQEKTVSF